MSGGVVHAFETFNICGHECGARCFDRDMPTESWDVYTFWKGSREFLIFPRETTRQKAIDSAEFILSDRERFGCFLMAEGTKRLNAANDIQETSRLNLRHPESLHGAAPKDASEVYMPTEETA